MSEPFEYEKLQAWTRDCLMWMSWTRSRPTLQALATPGQE
ncbi:hypothetical protein J007_05129 [Cryptococcus neoformans]|nr:hypothetical protein J007_05129 [Cryptococcus neoformans var. grubii]OXC59303.1 hypothetical protein C358_05248 [Cryptococcus neoformans var. grubii MW-RSA852]